MTTVSPKAIPNDAALLEAAWSRACRRLLERAGKAANLQPVMGTLEAFLENSGKRFRPRLLLGAHRVFADGAKPTPAICEAACGLEFFHNFALIHDDVIDGSPTRRGQPALHLRLAEALDASPHLGVSLAILAGDLMFGLAWETLAGMGNTEAMRYFAQVTQDTGCGEAFELVNAGQPLSAIAREDILRTYTWKTTRYSFEAPLTLGALAAGADPAIEDTMRAVASPLGTAFQIENDLHELEQLLPDEQAPPCDLRCGIKTIVLKEASLRLEPGDRARLDRVLAQPHHPGSLATINTLISRSGALGFMRAAVGEYFEQARRAAAEAPLEAGHREGLLALVHFAGANLNHSESQLAAASV